MESVGRAGGELTGGCCATSTFSVSISTCFPNTFLVLLVIGLACTSLRGCVRSWDINDLHVGLIGHALFYLEKK